jgi:hypothetical protein
MSPSAQRAQLDFVRLVAEEPSSLYFEQFLRDGYDAWPAAYQRRFSGLSTWQGVSRLKQSLRRLANAPQEGKMLLASRSLSLVRLAAQHLFRVCKHVLATDLSWPTYQRAIERQATRTSLQITTVSLRDDILRRGWSADDVVSALAEAAVAHGCDGLFLPAVDHLGIRLAIRQIVEEIRRRCKLNFVFVDAAQAFCHLPLDDCLAVADFVVAGSHKWMGAYLPTGIGFVRHLQVQRGGRQSDPLLHFTEQLATGALDRHSETANLTNLFACAGAVRDQQSRPAQAFAGASLSGPSLPESLREWRPLAPCPAMQSHIVLLETTSSPTRWASADVVRRHWLTEGLIVTGYDEGRVRVSRPLSPSEHKGAFTTDGDSAGA